VVKCAAFLTEHRLVMDRQMDGRTPDHGRYRANIASPGNMLAQITIQKLSCCRGTARRCVSVEILSSAAQLYDKAHVKRLAISE